MTVPVSFGSLILAEGPEQIGKPAGKDFERLSEVIKKTLIWRTVFCFFTIAAVHAMRTPRQRTLALIVYHLMARLVTLLTNLKAYLIPRPLQIIKKYTYMGYWPSVRSRWLDIGHTFFFCVFISRDEVEVHIHAKKERGKYPAILNEQAWSIKNLLYGIKHRNMINFPCGTKPVSRAGKIAPSCPHG